MYICRRKQSKAIQNDKLEIRALEVNLRMLSGRLFEGYLSHSSDSDESLTAEVHFMNKGAMA
jgi:hypothetical protein